MLARIRPEDKETALAVGVIAAVVWGLGVSLYALFEGPQDLAWLQWFGALLGGVTVCLAAPPLLLAGGSWLRLQAVRRRR
ncbi:MAG TPA: hypothetical protein VF121_06415 [Thermoanaerobaculia bacterium]|nr:hypothetical protein [Thermoanaerobaculia bacterium]